MKYFYLFSHCRLVHGYTNDAIYDLFTGRLLWVNHQIGRQTLRALQEGKSIEESAQDLGVDPIQIRNFLNMLVTLDYGFYQSQPIYLEKFRPYVMRNQEQKFVLHRPLSRLIVELSSSCSFSCSFCGFKQGLATSLCACGVWADTSTKVKLNLGKLLSDAAAIECKEIVVQGGDPFLQREQLYLLFELAHREKLPVTVHTPGINLTEQDWLLISKYGVKLVLPVFSDEQDLHDEISGTQGAFVELLEVLENFNTGLLKMLEAKVILTTKNVSKREAILDMLDDYGVNKYIDTYLPFEYLVSDNAGILNELPKHSLKQSYRDFPVSMGMFYYLTKGHECWQDQLAVTLNGDVVPCLPARKHIIGSLENESLLDILRLKKHYKYREASKDTYTSCRGCEFRFACKSCSMATEQLCGFWDGPGWQCQYEPIMGSWSSSIRSFSN